MNDIQTTSPVRSCAGAVPGTASLPTPKELTCHYHAAINGLYYAFLFGKMLITVRENIGVLTRENAENISSGKSGITGGWNAGTGLKGWMDANCPEINYKTAYRFLQMAEKALQAMATLGLEPTEENIKAFLEGKSQRQLLKPTEPLLLDDSKRYARLRENVYDFVHGLEGVQSSGDSLLLTPEDRYDLVQRLKSLTRKLEGEAI